MILQEGNLYYLRGGYEVLLEAVAKEDRYTPASDTNGVMHSKVLAVNVAQIVLGGSFILPWDTDQLEIGLLLEEVPEDELPLYVGWADIRPAFTEYLKEIEYTRLIKIEGNLLKTFKAISKGHGAFAGCHGMSEYGGRTQTLMALVKRKLITNSYFNYGLTRIGRRFLKYMDAA